MQHPIVRATPVAVRSPEELFTQLRSELPHLATQFVERVRDSVAGYEPGALVPDDDLYQTAMESIGLLLESLSAGEAIEPLFQLAESLGRRRARQQVPTESLTMAMQSDFRVIWNRLLEVSSEHRETTLALAQHVEPIWRIVESFSTATMQFYRAEEAQLAEDRLNHRQVAIGRLLAFRDPSTTSVAWVAGELGCSPSAEFTVVVTDQAESRDALFTLADALRHSAFYFHRSSGLVVAFWPRDVALPRVAACVERIRCTRAESVTGLGRLPRIVDALTNLLDALDPEVHRPVDLEEGLPVLARRALAEQSIDVEDRLSTALAGCPETEREKLREAVIHYLTTGSIQATAAALFYHRNTVLKRVNRFAALTGIDVTVPSEAAAVVLAWTTIGPSPTRTARAGLDLGGV